MTRENCDIQVLVSINWNTDTPTQLCQLSLSSAGGAGKVFRTVGFLFSFYCCDGCYVKHFSDGFIVLVLRL